MDKTIRATDVRLLHLHAVHTGVASLAMCLVVVDEVVVLIGDALVGQLLLNELHQRHRRLVVHADHAVATFTVTGPIGVVGHFLGFQHTHRIVDGAGGIAAHALTFTGRRSLDTRQVIQLNRVVNHTAVKQQLLLRHRQVAVATDAPAVVLVETFVGSVIGHEERLRTGLGQHFAVAQFVNQPHRCRVVVVIAQPTIDAFAPAFRGFLIQVVVRARRQREPTANNQQPTACG